MSYYAMDHAGWVQQRISATQCRKPTAPEARAATAEGEGWFAAPAELTPFHARALDILGIVGGGIYNAPIAWNRVVWGDRFLVVPWKSREMATFDGCDLTELVVLCHIACIRAAVRARSRDRLEITMHERRLFGSIAARHPDMADAVAAIDRALPGSHRIRNVVVGARELAEAAR